MSAAATAAGYLYASGRLRGRTAREQEAQRPEQERRQEKPVQRENIRVAVYRPEQRGAENLAERQPIASAEPESRRVPKVEYRVRRRWTAA
jgi:hypothetical protein